MKRTSLLLAVAVVLSGCQTMNSERQLNARSVYKGDNSVLYQVRSQTHSAEQAMQMASMAYAANDLDQALYQYLRAFELDPKQHSAMAWVGRIHRERGNAQLAQRALEQALSGDSQNLDALAEMGLLKLSQRDHAEALKFLTKAALLDQQRQVGEKLEALPEVSALRVDKQSPLRVYNGLGVLADLGNDFGSSQAYYQLAMQIEPRSAFVQNSRGYSYYLAGDWAQAERSYQLGIGYDASYKPIWRNYGLLLARMERYEEALSAFEQIEKRAEASNDVGYICLVEGKLDIAEQFFRSAIEQSPAHYATAWENLNRVQQVRRIRRFDSAAGSLLPEGEAVTQ